MVTEQTWKEFQDNGLLWWVNMLLHTFGWAICLDVDKETKEIKRAYPARVRFRGFAEKNNDEGYTKVTTYLKHNVSELLNECEPIG